MANVRRSLAYTIADSYLALPLQLVGTMIISRLLTPAEAGVFAVAAVFSAFASTFRDFGVAEYLIQEKELRAEHIRAALTVNIAISWAMSLALFVGAPFAAEFYRTPGVAEVMRVQAANFLLIPFGAVTMAYFRRELDFRPIFIANLLANLTSFAVSTICAYNGLGYMSLAWSSLAGVAITVAASLWFRPASFPRWPGLAGIGRVVQFGKFASGIYVFGQLGRGAPEMIIGRAQDMVAVGMFSRGGGLIELFNRTVLRAVMPICLPYFAKNNREQGNILQGYLKVISYLTAIGWPFLAFSGLYAFAAIRIIYGPQWEDAVPLAKILCIAGALELIHYLAKEALIAAQDVRRSNRLQIYLQSARIIGLFAVVPFGLKGAAYGLMLASIVGFLIAQHELAGVIGLRYSDLFRAVRHSLGVTTVVATGLLVMLWLDPVNETNFFRTGVAGGVITAVLWLLALRAWRHPLWFEIGAIASKVLRRGRVINP